MAFNLLVELPLSFSAWEDLSLELRGCADFGIECFPISDIEVFTGSYLGISVIGGEMTEERINAFRKVIFYLLECGYNVFELHSSSQFFTDNVELLIRKFFV